MNLGKGILRHAQRIQDDLAQGKESAISTFFAEPLDMSALSAEYYLLSPVKAGDKNLESFIEDNVQKVVLMESKKFETVKTRRIE